MRKITQTLAWFTVFTFPACPAYADGIDLVELAKIDAAAEASLNRKDCPGAVILVVHNDEVVFRKAFGSRALKPEKAAMTLDTVFDMASLTKPIATGTSILLLIERGKVRLSDPVAKHWPAFVANGKDTITIEHLLLHTSGLIADNPIADYADGRERAIERIAGLKPLDAPGTRFRYSDVNFIVLGELVERLGGLPLDQFAKKYIFGPLKMNDTGFNPTEKLKGRIAPTGLRDLKPILGKVHDPRAFHMGGVAGHAGLFSTADDLARYCRMLLRGGELDGTRLLSEKSVRLFTESHPVLIAARDRNNKGARSHGWDVDTNYSSPRGENFTKGEGFGHTGFTGTSVWIDPGSKTAIIILTNRVHPDDQGNVTRLRREIGTIVARAVGKK